MDYRKVKSMAGKNIAGLISSCGDASFDRYVKRYGWTNEPDLDEFIEYASYYEDDWIDFALDNGIIEEVDTRLSVNYFRGDKFQDVRNGKIYELASCPAGMVLINLEDGNFKRVVDGTSISHPVTLQTIKDKFPNIEPVVLTITKR